MRGRRYEVSTVGFDENLQLVGSDASGGPYWVGLRIPPFLSSSPRKRFLAVLAAARIGAKRRGRIVGFRQLLTIGCLMQEPQQEGAPPAPFYPLEAQVLTPWWRFTNGNVEWGIRRVPPQFMNTASPLNAENLQFMQSLSPAFLFGPSDAPPAPPFGGQIPGTGLIPELTAFYDIRSTWQEPSWCDASFEGPCDIVFYASIQQTNPQTQLKLPVPLPALTTTGIPPEDAFVANYGNAQNSEGVMYWRIGGSLIIEEDDSSAARPVTMSKPDEGSIKSPRVTSEEKRGPTI